MDIVDRLKEISQAIAEGNRDELTMRVPAAPERDADLVTANAAKEIECLRTELTLCNAYYEHHTKEIERLRAELAQSKLAYETLMADSSATIDNERAELELVREERIRLLGENTQVRDEAKTLRGALQKCSHYETHLYADDFFEQEMKRRIQGGEKDD